MMTWGIPGWGGWMDTSDETTFPSLAIFPLNRPAQPQRESMETHTTHQLYSAPTDWP